MSAGQAHFGVEACFCALKDAKKTCKLNWWSLRWRHQFSSRMAEVNVVELIGRHWALAS